MENSNIFIRVGNESKLLEDLSIDEIDDWINDLPNESLKRALFIVCCSLKHTKENCNKAIEYIEKNSLYEEEYDEDYEGNLCVSGASDEYAKKELLEILKGDNNG